MKTLLIKRSNIQSSYGLLWTVKNPYEENIFMHFTNGCTAITEERIPELVVAAELHGYYIERVSN